MGTVTDIVRPKFAIGELVHHRRFKYRGVIVDVDPRFQATEEWYQAVALSRPPKNKPWYHVLVDDAIHSTYVAERNLEPDKNTDPITHPMLWRIFSRLEGGRYIRTDPTH
jgi:heat shock protein HspQ